MLGNKLADLVTELALKLEKCAEASSQDAEQVKDILHQLDKIEMTLEVLKISKIGFALKKVKSAEGMSEDTKKLVSSLTKKWKGVAAGSVARTATSSSSAASGSSSAAGPLSRPSSAASNKASDVEAGSRAAAEATATTVSGKTEGAPKQTIANGNVKKEAPAVKKANGPKSVAQFPFGNPDDLPPQRAKVRDVFFTSFLKYPEAQQDEQRAARVAIAIEEELHKLTDAVLNTAAYGDKVRSLKYNLSANEDLRFRVIVGDVSAADLVVMKPEDMQAEAQRQAAEAARKTEYEARMLDWQEQNEDKLRKRLGIEDVGGSFTCRRCKKNKTAYQAKQTRSSDEPMTMFIRCLNCGNRWKEG